MVDAASLCFLLLNSAAVSFVGNSGQVTRVKYRSVIPKQVVASSRSLSEESVCIQSFAKECHVPRTKSIERTVVLCSLGKRPLMHGIIHWAWVLDVQRAKQFAIPTWIIFSKSCPSICFISETLLENLDTAESPNTGTWRNLCGYVSISKVDPLHLTSHSGC